MLDADAVGRLGWQQVHDALVRIAKRRAGLDFEEGQWLRQAHATRVHERLGYGSFVEYVERLFGYAPRMAFEKLRVAEALESLPQMASSLRDGRSSWSSLRELTRVATNETEHAWLEAAHGRTVREVETLVSGRRPGDLPSDAKDPRLERHVLRFEVSGEVLATFRAALAKLRREAAGGLDDDAALLLMARYVLGGSGDDGRASYQIALTVCDECQRATQTGRGEAFAVPPEIVEMARCDAQALPATHAGVKPAKAKQEVPPAIRRAVLRRDGHCCRVPGCRHATFVDVHHIEARGEGGKHDADNLLTLCGAHHRAAHRGELLLIGTASGVQFKHADGTAYGELPSATQAGLLARAFRALRRLGFGERETRQALARCVTHVGTTGDAAALDSLLREALGLLTADNWPKAS